MSDEVDNLELYKKHRPTLLKHVTGQTEAVRTLKKFLENDKLPHTLLFTGPSGCGKTTLARILVDKIDCKGPGNFSEVNAADKNGIDLVRDIRRQMNRTAIGCKSRCWLIDEAHELTTAAQNAFLKILEDTPRHVYFFLATTHPQKLIKTVRTRSTEIVCSSISQRDLKTLVTSVAEKEGKKLTDEVLEKLVEEADGSARQALVYLNKIIDLENEEEQLESLKSSKDEAAAIELWKAISWKGVKWPTVAKTLKSIELNNNNAEGLRRLILACAKNNLLNGQQNCGRAFTIVDIFRDNFFDSGAAGLVAACYEVVSGADK